MNGSRAHRLWRAYDVMAALILLPTFAVLAISLPGDIANHNGHTLRGTATVTKIEPFRGGDIATYEVRSSTGSVVGVTEDVYGLDADTVGQSAPVNYVVPGPSDAYVAAYVVGEDPLATNATILGAVGLALLVALGFIARRIRRLVSRLRAHRQASRPYRANWG